MGRATEFGLCVAIALGVNVGCGGTTVHDGGHENGGDATDSGAGGANGGRAGGDAGHGGGVGPGGGRGTGGTIECPCDPIGCPPGSREVSVPGQCCPSCESCEAVDCAAPKCAPGQTLVTLPGQCCPQCYGKPQVDDGGAPMLCGSSSAASCRVGGSACPATWTQAIHAWGTCDPPPKIAAYLANCGTYHALIDSRANGVDRYFYDEKGTLVGHDRVGESCESYSGGFVDPSPDACHFEPHCGVPRDDDGGIPTCGNGVIDEGEACDGVVGSVTCASATMGLLMHGTVACAPTCQFDLTGCRK
jgi:hypothetical protein